jgi:hypothetical protein
MKCKHKTISNIVLATLILLSLCAVARSPASVSGQTAGTKAPLVTNLVGGTMAGTGPAASTAFSTGQTEIFAVDTHGTLWNTSVVPGSNGTWNSLGGESTSSPAAVSWTATYLRFDVFARGTDGALWHKSYQNGWSKWESLGGQLASGTSPAVSSWSAGRLDVFIEGTDGALWHKWWTGTSWSSWQSLGGTLTSSPAATSPLAGSVIYVFARGSDGAVWEKYYQNSWSSWQSLGGQVAPNTGPAVSQDRTLFVQGTNHQLQQKNYTSSGWTAWGTLNTRPPEALSIASPGAVSVLASPVLASPHPLVCVSSTNGTIWYDVSNASGNWEQWYSAGSPPYDNPALTQGIANDGTYNYVINNTALFKYTANWNLVASNTNAAAEAGGVHMGDGDVYKGIIYVLNEAPANMWPVCYMARFYASNLSVIDYIPITSVGGNPPGYYTVNAAGEGVNYRDNFLLIVSYQNGSVYKYNLTTLDYVGVTTPSYNLTTSQGVSYYNGFYYVTCDYGVVRMNTDGTSTHTIIPMSAFTQGGEREGLDVKSDFVRVLCGGYVYTFPFQASWGE